MPKHWFCLLFLLSHLGVSQADEPAVFTPPQAYPAERYESGWSKNPFTLKTVVPVAAQGSFATDLAIGAHYGSADNPTVVVVNTKTNERILLRKDQPGPGGLTLKELHLTSSRRECQVEVVLGGEAAVLTYDSTYLGQMAANEATRAAASKPSAAPSVKGVRLPPLPLPAVPPPPSPAVKVTQLTPPAAMASGSNGNIASLPARIRSVAPPLPPTPKASP